MRQVIELLRLKHEHHLSIREVTRSCGIASSTVGDYLLRAEAAGLGWPLPEAVGQTELEARLCAVAPPRIAGTPPPPVPDWAHLHAELRRPNVTLRLLSQEYIRTDPSGLKYSRFCERYQQWRKTLEPPLRQVHVPGEKMFVDWAGQTVPIRNGADGITQPASLFVAALEVSGKIFAEAFPEQKLHSWISAHVHAYQFYGGVAALTVPDNTRTAVVEPCRLQPWRAPNRKPCRRPIRGTARPAGCEAWTGRRQSERRRRFRGLRTTRLPRVPPTSAAPGRSPRPKPDLRPAASDIPGRSPRPKPDLRPAASDIRPPASGVWQLRLKKPAKTRL